MVLLLWWGYSGHALMLKLKTAFLHLVPCTPLTNSVYRALSNGLTVKAPLSGLCVILQMWPSTQSAESNHYILAVTAPASMALASDLWEMEESANKASSLFGWTTTSRWGRASLSTEPLITVKTWGLLQKRKAFLNRNTMPIICTHD